MILPIDAANLASAKNAGIVGAWMLFPDDAKWRNKMILNSEAIDGLHRLWEGKVHPDEFETLLLKALDAASPGDVKEQLDTRVPLGHAAGMILYRAMLKERRPGERPLGTAMREVELALTGKTASASKRVNEAVWRTYRPVAALWAAFIYHDDESDEPAFPCRYGDLPMFLAIAEGMRKLGETASSPHRKGRPILGAGEAVQLPDDVLAMLPRGTLVLA